MFFEAVKNNDLEQLKLLVRHDLVNAKKHINQKNNFGNTALHYASTRGYFEIVKFLIENGADPNPKNDFDNTPLHSIFMIGGNRTVETNNKYIKIVKFLIDNGANVSEINNDGFTPLHVVLISYTIKQSTQYRQSPEILELLIENYFKDHTNIYKKTKFNSTLLHFAASTNCTATTSIDNKFIKTMEFLIEKYVETCADINEKDSKGHTALCIACSRGNIDIVKHLVKFGADIGQLVDYELESPFDDKIKEFLKESLENNYLLK